MPCNLYWLDCEQWCVCGCCCNSRTASKLFGVMNLIYILFRIQAILQPNDYGSYYMPTAYGLAAPYIFSGKEPCFREARANWNALGFLAVYSVVEVAINFFITLMFVGISFNGLIGFLHPKCICKTYMWFHICAFALHLGFRVPAFVYLCHSLIVHLTVVFTVPLQLVWACLNACVAYQFGKSIEEVQNHFERMLNVHSVEVLVATDHERPQPQDSATKAAIVKKRSVVTIADPPTSSVK